MGSNRNAFVALLINCGDPWIIPNLHRRFILNNHIFHRYPSPDCLAWNSFWICGKMYTFPYKFKTNFMPSSSRTTTIFLSSGIILIIYRLFSSNKERQTLLCRFYNQILLAVTIFQGQYLTVKVDGSRSLITPLSAQISAPKFQNIEGLIPRKSVVFGKIVAFDTNTTIFPWCLPQTPLKSHLCAELCLP